MNSTVLCVCASIWLQFVVGFLFVFIFLDGILFCFLGSVVVILKRRMFSLISKETYF